MARAGRKRKPQVKRTPSGRIALVARERRPDVRNVAIAQRIRLGANPDEATMQREGYELGRLWRSGALATEADFPHPNARAEEAFRLHEAGVTLAVLAARFHARSGSGRPTPAAASAERVHGESLRDDDPEEWRRLQMRYQDATKAIGRGNHGPVWSVVILDQAIWPVDLPRLRAGLRGIAAWLG